MLRRPYTLNTVTVGPVYANDTYILLASSVGLNLAGSDWAYLKIEEYGKVEIVKVILQEGNEIQVIRGIDNTKPEDFVSPKVSYTVTVEEVKDGIYPHSTLILSGEGIALVAQLEVKVEPLVIQYKGVHYSFSKDENLDIGRQENAYGCCPKDNKVGSLGLEIISLRAVVSHPYGVEGFNIRFAEKAGLVGGSLQASKLAVPDPEMSVGIPALLGGALITPPFSNVPDDMVAVPTLQGGSLKEVATGNLDEQTNGVPSVTGGALKVVPTGSADNPITVTPALIGGQLS
jgi:hypothetical protein